MPRLHSGAACFSPRSPGKYGRESRRRRHRRRNNGHSKFSFPAYPPSLCHLSAGRLYMLFIHSSRRRCTWHVRLSCCEDGVDQVEAQLAKICAKINRSRESACGVTDAAARWALRPRGYCQRRRVRSSVHKVPEIAAATTGLVRVSQPS